MQRARLCTLELVGSYLSNSEHLLVFCHFGIITIYATLEVVCNVTPLTLRKLYSYRYANT